MIAISTSGRKLEIPLRHFLNAGGIPVSACTLDRCAAVYIDGCHEVRTPVVVASDRRSIAAKLKDAVLELVEQIVTEEVVLGVVTTQTQATRAPDGGRRKSVTDARIDRLTPREREVFELLVRGTSSKDIAALLGISARTVDVYRSRVSAKLEVKHITDLVRIAIAAGIDRVPRE